MCFHASPRHSPHIASSSSRTTCRRNAHLSPSSWSRFTILNHWWWNGSFFVVSIVSSRLTLSFLFPFFYFRRTHTTGSDTINVEPVCILCILAQHPWPPERRIYFCCCCCCCVSMGAGRRALCVCSFHGGRAASFSTTGNLDIYIDFFHTQTTLFRCFCFSFFLTFFYTKQRHVWLYIYTRHTRNI